MILELSLNGEKLNLCDKELQYTRLVEAKVGEEIKCYKDNKTQATYKVVKVKLYKRGNKLVAVKYVTCE